MTPPPTALTEWCAICNHMLAEHDGRCKECRCTQWRDPTGYSIAEIERIRRREGI